MSLFLFALLPKRHSKFDDTKHFQRSLIKIKTPTFMEFVTKLTKISSNRSLTTF